MNHQLFVVLKVRSSSDPTTAFEFIGVFDSEDLARAACRDFRYMLGPAILNEDLGDERQEWPGATYPHMEPLLPASDDADKGNA